jgi:hypothetical protein
MEDANGTGATGCPLVEGGPCRAMLSITHRRVRLERLKRLPVFLSLILQPNFYFLFS